MALKLNWHTGLINDPLHEDCCRPDEKGRGESKEEAYNCTDPRRRGESDQDADQGEGNHERFVCHSLTIVLRRKSFLIEGSTRRSHAGHAFEPCHPSPAFEPYRERMPRPVPMPVAKPAALC